MFERKNQIFYLNIHFATPWTLLPGAAVTMAFPGYAPQIEIIEEGSGLWNKPCLELDVELSWGKNLLEKTGTFCALRTEQSVPGLTLNCLVAISCCYKSSTEHES